MVPSQAILEKITSLWAAYIIAQSGGGGLFLKLILSPFTPSPNLVTADVTIDPDWFRNVTGVGNAFIGTVDPATQNLRVGNNGWANMDISMSATPRTIYGIALQVPGTFNIWASALLPNPVVVNGTNQVLELPTLKFDMPRSAVR